MSPTPPPAPPPIAPFELPVWWRRLFLTLRGLSGTHLVTLVVVPSAIVVGAAWVKAGGPLDWPSIKSDLHLGLISLVSLLVALPQRSLADNSRLKQGLLLKAGPRVHEAARPMSSWACVCWGCLFGGLCAGSGALLSGCASSASDWTAKDSASARADAQLDVALARACAPAAADAGGPAICTPTVVHYASCQGLENNSATLARHTIGVPDAAGVCP